MMSRKDYKAFAEILAGHYTGTGDEEDQVILDVAYEMAGVFKRDNPRFDHKRFIAAVKGE